MAALVMTSCKSQESAYRAAYEKAKAQEATQVATTPVAVPQQTTVVTTPTQVATTETVPVQTTTNVADAELRTIKGGYSVVEGAAVKTYGVVVGSFSLQANAQNLYSRLAGEGWQPTVVKTNETISGITGWYRVVAASYDNKEQAVQTRDKLRAAYNGAWLLYSK